MATLFAKRERKSISGSNSFDLENDEQTPRLSRSNSGGPAKLSLTRSASQDNPKDELDGSDHDIRKDHRSNMSRFSCMSSIRFTVLLVLCLQNSLFTLLRRYSQGILKETYSKYECLLVGEVIKIVFSAWMIQQQLAENGNNNKGQDSNGAANAHKNTRARLTYLVMTSKKMIVLAMIYGAMNILSFVSLRNIGAGMFTIFAQCKILSTGVFSSIILRRKYSWTKWRALIALMLGVLLFSEPIWGNPENLFAKNEGASPLIGTVAVLIEVTLSGFASIYFEKVIKTDPLQLSIWERNFQLALGSFPVYVAFIIADGGGTAGFGGGWSVLASIVALLGAAGGLLVALSIKYGDSILKTLATTGAIVLSSLLDWVFLDGPLTPSMMIAGCQVIISICNYTFDTSPEIPDGPPPPEAKTPMSPRPEKTVDNDNDDNDDEGRNGEVEQVPLKMAMV